MVEGTVAGRGLARGFGFGFGLGLGGASSLPMALTTERCCFFPARSNTRSQGLLFFTIGAG
jgi:hypothetical protein